MTTAGPSTRPRSSSFEEFFLRELRSLEAIALGLTGRPGLAEELAQEAMLVVYRRWSTVEHPACLRNLVPAGRFSYVGIRGRHLHPRRQGGRLRGAAAPGRAGPGPGETVVLDAAWTDQAHRDRQRARGAALRRPGRRDGGPAERPSDARRRSLRRRRVHRRGHGHGSRPVADGDHDRRGPDPDAVLQAALPHIGPT
jgi:DNA-directed RNA polymerase specialized sigma24 family protein